MVPETSEEPSKAASVIKEAMRESSWRSHRDHCARMARWGVKLPCTHLELAEFIGWLSENKHTRGKLYDPETVRAMLSSIHRVHETLGWPSPRDHYLVSQAIAGYKARFHSELVGASIQSTSESSSSSVAGKITTAGSRKPAVGPHIVSMVMRAGVLDDKRLERLAVLFMTGYFTGLRPAGINCNFASW